MNGRKTQNSVLTEAEITALSASFEAPSRSDEGGFFRHDFSTREEMLLASWNVLKALMANQGEALKAIFKRDFRREHTVICHPPVCGYAQDFVIALPERALLISTEISPFAGQSYLSIDGDLIDRLMSHISGGVDTHGVRVNGPLTPGERRIGERMARGFFRAMEEVWTRHLHLSIGNLDTRVPTTQLSITSLNRRFVKFSYVLSTGGRDQSEIALLLPFDGLRLNAERLTTGQTELVTQPQQNNRHGELYRVLPDIPIEVIGVVMSREISIGDLIATQVGTVIPINDQMEVSLHLGENCFAKGRYEVEQGKQVCRIVKINGQTE